MLNFSGNIALGQILFFENVTAGNLCVHTSKVQRVRVKYFHWLDQLWTSGWASTRIEC